MADLPPGYQSVSRVAHLAGRERAEREAIIEALSRAGGNKVHAAHELGISRSTLYARMKALGIAGPAVQFPDSYKPGTSPTLT